MGKLTAKRIKSTLVKHRNMKIIFIILLFFTTVCSEAQTKAQTVKYINDKLKTHSSIFSGYYEIEVSEYGNLTIHRYDKNEFSDQNDDLHFVDLFDFVDVNIKPKVTTSNQKKYYSIIFECKDSDNCISESLIHNSKKRRANEIYIGITNEKVFQSLLDKFIYLKKISSKI